MFSPSRCFQDKRGSQVYLVPQDLLVLQDKPPERVRSLDHEVPWDHRDILVPQDFPGKKDSL